MSKNWILIALIIIIIAIVIYIYYPRKTDTINLKIKNQDFSLEVAKTIRQKNYGLMNRSTLCPNCGMIFVFDYQTPQFFWMKDTLIPLDIIFIDQNQKVINIAQGQPQSLAPIKSNFPAQYVIELNSGTAQKIGLNPGDTLNLLKSLTP